jgi:hypothetical protein
VDPIRVRAEHAQVTRRSGSTKSRYSILNTRLVEHKYIRVALDDERRAFPTDSFGDLRDSVEQIPLVEDLRLGRVEVLGLGVTERPGPEADYPSPPVRDGEGDPTRKTLPTPRRKKPGRIENTPVEIQPPSSCHKSGYTARRRIPQTKFSYSRKLYMAVIQVAAGLLSFWGFGSEEVLVIVGGGGGQGPVDRASTEVTFPRGARVSPAFKLQVYAESVGEVGDRFGEVQRLEIHYQLDGVPATRTAKTVVEALVRGDAKGRGFLLVVWVGTEACEAGSLAPEGRELGGHLDDPGRLPDLFYAAL